MSACDTQRPSCSTRIDCIIQEVVVQPEQDNAPPLGWLLGHTRLLYVEISPVGREWQRRQTETGILLQDKRFFNRDSEEIWVFGSGACVQHPPELAESAASGERMIFCVNTPVDLVLRVLGSHATWHTAFGLRAPSQLLAEGQFCVTRKRQSEIRVPLASKGRICGEALIVAINSQEKKDELRGCPDCSTIGRFTDDDTLLLMEEELNATDSRSEWEELIGHDA